MKHIILEAKEIDGLVFDLADLEVRLNTLKDPRDKRGRVYTLGSLLSMIVLAKLSGQDKPKAIFEWIRLRKQEFVTIFKMKRDQTPCLNTIRTVLGSQIVLSELEQTLQRYLYEQYGGQNSVLIGIDGKTMRGTIPKGYTQGLHLLSAYLVEEGIVLKQIEVASKQNEISAAPQLLAGLDLKGKIVCADAMQTQRTFCVDVLARGGNYVLWVKQNQQTLLADIEQFFNPPRRAAGWHIPALPQTEATIPSKGHGRIERRTLTLMQDEQQFIDWPGIQQVFRLTRYTKEVRTGVETTTVVYGLTSCNFDTANAATLLDWTQKYWGIENGLHYRRDVSLYEDATRIKDNRPLAQAIAIINNFIVGLIRKLGFVNLPSARRRFDVQIARQLVF